MTATASRLCMSVLCAVSMGVALAQADTPSSGDATGTPSAGRPPQAFLDADKNHDGKLDEAEFRAFNTGHGATSERPGEGMPATEHQAKVLRNFKDEDLNGDGYISPDELGQTR